MHRLIKMLGQELSLPVDDYFAGLKACTSHLGITLIIIIIATFLAAWWIYVPLHELFHAFGCILGGGEVSRLELSEIYGAVYLSRFFPYISPGSEYAGRLTDFNTYGNDLTYLLTVFFPYSLTVFIGIPMLRFAGIVETSPLFKCMAFGSSLPVAYAPFISITGDYYEIGSIIITRIASFIVSDFQIERWRSDDLIRLVDELILSGEIINAADILGMALSFVLGTVAIFITYRIGMLWSKHVFKL